MSKKEKLEARLLSVPNDFTFEELVTLLGYYGFYKTDSGKTSGSRVKFKNDETGAAVVVHKPHNPKGKNVFKIGALQDILHQLGKEVITIKGTLEYKGYVGSVEYSREDECLYGHVLGIRSILLYEGYSVTELRKDFEECIDDYLEMCKEDGMEPEKSYDGKLNLRVSPDLHYDACMCAAKQGKNLNTFIAQAIEAAVKSSKA